MILFSIYGERRKKKRDVCAISQVLIRRCGGSERYLSVLLGEEMPIINMEQNVHQVGLKYMLRVFLWTLFTNSAKDCVSGLLESVEYSLNKT